MAKTTKAAPKKTTPTAVLGKKKATSAKSGTIASLPALLSVARTWNSMHIFGDGNLQLVGKGVNRTVKTEDLKGLDAVIANLATQQQKGTKISLANASSVHLFNGSFADFRPNSDKNKPQRIGWSAIDVALIEKLYDQINAIPSSPSPVKRDIIDIVKEIQTLRQAGVKAAQKAPVKKVKAALEKKTKKTPRSK